MTVKGWLVIMMMVDFFLFLKDKKKNENGRLLFQSLVMLLHFKNH